MSPELILQDIEKSFGGTKALRGVSLALGGAAVVGLIGPNGAGKTTLLNVISGFLVPDRGTCALNGTSTRGMAPHEIARHGLARTFQDVRLARDMTVADNVLLALPGQKGESAAAALFGAVTARGAARALRRAGEILEVVGLQERARQRTGELSYGQQKLLSLACCIASGAPVLLLDEPVAGVHPELIEKILDLLRGFREEGRLVLLIEHDLAAVSRTADRLVVLDHGSVLADGPPAEVLHRPAVLEAYIA